MVWTNLFSDQMLTTYGFWYCCGRNFKSFINWLTTLLVKRLLAVLCLQTEVSFISKAWSTYRKQDNYKPTSKTLDKGVTSVLINLVTFRSTTFHDVKLSTVIVRFFVSAYTLSQIPTRLIKSGDRRSFDCVIIEAFFLIVFYLLPFRGQRLGHCLDRHWSHFGFWIVNLYHLCQL